MRSQPVQLIIPLALHRLASSQCKPAGDNLRIRNAFELRRGRVCLPDNTHVVNHVINRLTIVILSGAKKQRSAKSIS